MLWTPSDHLPMSSPSRRTALCKHLPRSKILISFLAADFFNVFRTDAPWGLQRISSAEKIAGTNTGYGRMYLSEKPYSYARVFIEPWPIATPMMTLQVKVSMCMSLVRLFFSSVPVRWCLLDFKIDTGKFNNRENDWHQLLIRIFLPI